MSFIVQESPDAYTLLTVGATHTLTALMLVIYTVIVGREIGLTEANLHGFVALEIVVMGIATLLQSLKSRFGSGHLIVHIPSTISMSAFIVAVSTFGMGAAAGGLILAALAVIAFARILPRLQTIFPPEVAGVLLVVLGMSLVETGVKRFTGLEGGHIEGSAVASASTTLIAIVVISVWGGKRVRIFAVIAGTVAGLAVAVLLGNFGGAEIEYVAQQPLFAIPVESYVPPRPVMILGAAVPLMITQLIVALQSVGAGVAIDRLNDEKWKRADLPMISRLVSCQGFGLLLNGLTGTLPTGTSSANLGLVAMTGVAARKVGTVAGIMLILLAFLPQVSALIIQIPLPVVGAIVVYTAGYMLVLGMELILSRMLNSRRIFMVGLSITVGAALLLMPELRAAIPEDLRPILGSPLTMGGVAAIALNLLFRIGISEHAEIQLSGPHAARDATLFLEEQGATWGARLNVITRACAAMSEALEAMQTAEMVRGPIRLLAEFDEFKVSITVSYPGRAFSLEAGKKVDLNALLMEDDDSGLDEAMSRMSSHLIRNLADKVLSTERAGRATLQLQFSH